MKNARAQEDRIPFEELSFVWNVPLILHMSGSHMHLAVCSVKSSRTSIFTVMISNAKLNPKTLLGQNSQFSRKMRIHVQPAKEFVNF